MKIGDYALFQYAMNEYIEYVILDVSNNAVTVYDPFMDIVIDDKKPSDFHISKGNMRVGTLDFGVVTTKEAYQKRLEQDKNKLKVGKND